MHVHHVRSTFPLALGAKITGVDDASFSQTGESFATIVMPNCESIRSKPLQADDTALAYEFAKKFPGANGSARTRSSAHESSSVHDL
jgi:inosine/xanthosine triphosphate pyrophosphatase family protein